MCCKEPYKRYIFAVQITLQQKGMILKIVLCLFVTDLKNKRRTT